MIVSAAVFLLSSFSLCCLPHGATGGRASHVWVPVGLSRQDGLPLHESTPEKLLVQLCKIDFRIQMREPVRFADFADLVTFSNCHVEGKSITVPLSMLLLVRKAHGDTSEDIDAYLPSGLIFGPGRSATTVIANMFAALPSVRMLQEEKPLGLIVRSCYIHSATCNKEAVGQMMRDIATLYCMGLEVTYSPDGGFSVSRYMSSKKKDAPRHCVFKFQSIVTSSADLVLNYAFPDAPWIFVSRDPVEVMVSHFASPAVIPCLHFQDNPPPELYAHLEVVEAAASSARVRHLTADSEEALCAAQIAEHLRSVLSVRRTCGKPSSSAIAACRGAIVDAKDVPELIPLVAGNHFGIAMNDRDSNNDTARMLAAQRSYSKKGRWPVTRVKGSENQEDYVDDSKVKRRMATPEIKEAAELLLSELYAELTSFREVDSKHLDHPRIAAADGAPKRKKALPAATPRNVDQESQKSLHSFSTETREEKSAIEAAAPNGKSKQKGKSERKSTASSSLSLSSSSSSSSSSTSTPSACGSLPFAVPVEPLDGLQTASEVMRFLASRDFVCNYWERSPAFFRAHAWIEKLEAGMPSVERITSSQTILSTPEGKGDRPFRFLDGAFYKRPKAPWLPKQGESSISGEIIGNGLSNGYSVVFDGIHLWPEHGGVRAVAHALRKALGRRTNVNGYLSPGGLSVAMDAHTDQHDFLIVQVEGAKRWRVWLRPAWMLPLQEVAHSYGTREDAKVNITDLGPPYLDRVLSVGDMLYVPRGGVHLTSTAEGLDRGVLEEEELDLGAHSLHLTISIATDAFHLPWVVGAQSAPGIPQHDYFRNAYAKAMRTLAERDPALRKSVQVGAETRSEWVERVRSAMHRVVDEVVDGTDYLQNLDSMFQRVLSSGDAALRPANVNWQSEIVFDNLLAQA